MKTVFSSWKMLLLVAGLIVANIGVAVLFPKGLRADEGCVAEGSNCHCFNQGTKHGQCSASGTGDRSCGGPGVQGQAQCQATAEE